MAVVVLAMVTHAFAQFPLQSADGKSGLLAQQGASLISYDVSESRVGFKYFWSQETTSVDDPLTEVSLDAGFAANKGKRDLFKGGSFTPGYDLGLTVSHTIEHPNRRPGYQQFFGRAVLESAEQKTVETTAANVYELKSQAATTLGLGGGYNYAFTENVVWGGSATFQYRWHSTEGNKEKDVCVEEMRGVDVDAKPVTVAACEKRFVGPLVNEAAGQLRTDFSWNIAALAGTRSATIGLLASASMDIASKTSYNVSLGPALHRPGHPNQVVFAALFEGIDIGNRLGESPKFRDQFRFRVYVGVPFELLK